VARVVPRFVVTLVGNCLGLWVASEIVPHVGYGHKLATLLGAGIILGIVNFLVRPITVLLSLPLVIVTLGFFLLVINALMVWVTTKIVSGLHIHGFWSFIGTAIVLWLVNMLVRMWARDIDEKRRKPWQLKKV
jgi:putative membrane protein